MNLMVIITVSGVLRDPPITQAQPFFSLIPKAACQVQFFLLSMQLLIAIFLNSQLFNEHNVFSFLLLL